MMLRIIARLSHNSIIASQVIIRSNSVLKYVIPFNHCHSSKPAGKFIYYIITTKIYDCHLHRRTFLIVTHWKLRPVRSA